MHDLCTVVQTIVDDVFLVPPRVELRHKGDLIEVVFHYGGSNKLVLRRPFTHNGLVKSVPLHKRCYDNVRGTLRRLRGYMASPNVVFMYLQVLEFFPSTLFSSNFLEREIASLVAGRKVGGKSEEDYLLRLVSGMLSGTQEDPKVLVS